MKLFLIPILILVILCGCTNNTDGMIDCGYDEQCFLDAAATCRPAKVIYSDSQDTGYGAFSIQIESQLHGIQGDNCVYYMKILQMDLSQTDALEYEELFEGLEGTDMTCNVPLSMFQALTVEDLSNQVMALYETNCQGTYKDKLEEIMETIMDQLEDLLGTTFQIVPGSLSCSEEGISVMVANTGTVPLTDNELFVMIDEEFVTHAVTIEPGETETLTFDCGGSCSPGDHSVIITTLVNTLEETVACP